MPEEGTTQPNPAPVAPAPEAQPNPAPAAPAPEAQPSPMPIAPTPEVQPAPVAPAPEAPQVAPVQSNPATPQTPAGEFDAKEIADSKGIIWMSYLGLLALVPFFSQKDNKFTRKHAVQGLNMCIFAAIVDGGLGILSGVISGIALSSYSTLWLLGVASAISIVISAFSCFIGVIAIIGIVNAESGKYKDLPLVSKIKFIKK